MTDTQERILVSSEFEDPGALSEDTLWGLAYIKLGHPDDVEDIALALSSLPPNLSEQDIESIADQIKNLVDAGPPRRFAFRQAERHSRAAVRAIKVRAEQVGDKTTHDSADSYLELRRAPVRKFIGKVASII
jgi:hypothetical protein